MDNLILHTLSIYITTPTPKMNHREKAHDFQACHQHAIRWAKTMKRKRDSIGSQSCSVRSNGEKKWPPRKIEILFPFTTLNTLCLSSVWWNFEVRRRGLPECLKRSCSRVAVPHISTKGLPRRAHNSFALDRRATVLYCLFCQHLLFHSLLQ